MRQRRQAVRNASQHAVNEAEHRANAWASAVAQLELQADVLEVRYHVIAKCELSQPVKHP